MMIPVQEIIVKSNNNRQFKVFIEKPADNNFKWWLFAYDPKINFSGGHSSKTIHNSSEDAFDEFLEFITNYLNKSGDSDSIEYIDNPCNCELLSEVSQKVSVTKMGMSFPVKVNGKKS